MARHYRHSKAFSLVELAIVLVILGLLAGGVLSGQSLIRAAELRSIANDFERYRTSVFTFRDKYLQLPGDMTNATDFWGRVGGGTGQCTDVATDTDSGLPTCNGDGNGQIDGLAGNNEKYRVWEHLAAAGLIEGNYTGIAAGTNFVVAGTNVPKSRIANAGYTIYFLADGFSNGNEWPNSYRNLITFGKSVNDNYAIRPAITPQEAWNIDTKLDDGKPAYGKVYTQRRTSAYAPNCVTSDTQTDAAYDVASSNVSCMLGYILGI